MQDESYGCHNTTNGSSYCRKVRLDFCYRSGTWEKIIKMEPKATTPHAAGHQRTWMMNVRANLVIANLVSAISEMPGEVGECFCGGRRLLEENCSSFYLCRSELQVRRNDVTTDFLLSWLKHLHRTQDLSRPFQV